MPRSKKNMYKKEIQTGPPTIMTKKKKNRNENDKNLSLCCQCNSGIKSFFQERKRGQASSVAHEAAEAKQKKKSCTDG